MGHSRNLEIIQTCEVDVCSYYRWLLLLWMYGICLPFVIVCIHTVHLHGEDTHRLQHDIDTATPRPVPVPSMWVDYHPLKSGSAYVPVGPMEEGMFEALILYFPWNLQMTALLQLPLHLLLPFIILHTLGLKRSLRQYKIWRRVIFLGLVTLYSFLLCLVMDGTLTMAYVTVRDNFLTWLESNIIEVYLSDGINEKITVHPFTLGNYPPYYLAQDFRYLGEDVVFQCEYNITTHLNIEPGYVTTWWRKNGVPIEVNSRMYVNVSIENIDNDIPFLIDLQSYVIRSTLTIEIIEQRDYAIYTCDYINPLPGRVRVSKYAQQNNPNDEAVQTPQPMSPDPKCSCQPTFQERAENRSLSARNVCFSEFVLKPFSTVNKTVEIRPGGILVTAASYKTVASMSDIKVDVTFEGNTDRKGNSECCSLFIKAYWALFRKGSFVDLPISRLLGSRFLKNTTSHLVIVKYSCICIDSFGIRNYCFYRDHFNSTIGKEEEIEISHPVSLNIQPRENGSIPLLDGFSFCHKSDVSLCRYVEALLDNSLYIFYTYDVFFLTGLVITVLFMTRVRTWSSVLIAKPLRKLCFPNFHYIMPFTAVRGPPVHVNGSNEDQMSWSFDIYLSYSEDDEYDTEIARYVKILLTEADFTVFDSVEDILPGHLVARKSSKAINKSRCFVVIVSETFINDNYKKMEFAAIQDSIVSRNSVPKECMLIVKVDDCDIVGLHHVPCIHVPAGLKETFSLDQSSINQILKWINTATVPVNRNETTIMSLLQTSGFTIKSAIFIAVLLGLSTKSFFFKSNSPWPEGTDLVNVG